MIVFSLLLILVAVTLLVLGLAGGSSALLISSIAASLLAAVALVIGARQAAGRRRAAATRSTGAAGTATPPGVPPSPDADPFFADAPGLDEFAGDPPPSRVPAAGDPDHWDEEEDYEVAPPPSAEPDYDHASSVIGAARNTDEADESWRRDPAVQGPPVPGRSDGPDTTAAAAATDRSGPPPATSGGSGATDEFDEPDEDDPADEPLPQAVRPGDAVRVARMDTEVLVIDGRPRYHLADCPHLVGRLTEPLPTKEAVELGFSPCGLCRPVNRLVAQTAGRR